MADLGPCATSDHPEPVPAVVAGVFQLPWWGIDGRDAECAAYCGRCAYLLGAQLSYFTPDDPTIDLAALSPETASHFEEYGNG